MDIGGDFWVGAGAASVAIWSYLVVLHGHFWRLTRLQLRAWNGSQVQKRIAVVIPARNEADVIGRAVTSLFQQRGITELQVFIVDDNSEDGTAEEVRRAAEACGRSGAVRVIRGRALETGWTGKLWAVHQGVEQALQDNPDFLLLTDADIEHGRDMLARLLAQAEQGNYALASLMVKLHCRSTAERLLIAAFVYFFFLLYPPDWIASPRSRVAGAAGGCMLIRPEALQRAGGIEAIRGEIIDDCALARTVKSSGGRLWLGMEEGTQSLRAYQSFGEIERMIARTAFNQLQHSTWLLLGAVAGLAVTFLLPLVAFFSGRAVPAALGGVAYGLMCRSYLPMVRSYGLTPLWCLTLPASAMFYMGATVHSAMKFWTGRGGEWKGRVQDVQRNEERTIPAYRRKERP